MPPPAGLPTNEQVIAENLVTLQTQIVMAAQQKTALGERVGTLRDAAEMEVATVDEENELPVRELQLSEWKKYAIFLGRIPSQEGWPLSANWPKKPENGIL